MSQFTTNLLALLLLFTSALPNLYAQDSKVLEKEEVEGFVFDTLAEVPTTSVKNQYKSGTCWSFAATSFVETEILRISNQEFDLSEMYSVYFAYQSKAQSYVRLHGHTNFGPGGQAHDVMDVIRKHGFLAEADYQGFVSGFDNHIHGELDNVLHGFVKDVVKNPSGELSTAWQNAFKSILNSYIQDPSSMQEKAMALYKQSGFNPDDYVELTSYKYRDYYQALRLEVPDNWSFASYYNIPLDEMMELIQSALKGGYSVCWDGDVSNQGFSHRNGVALFPENNVENLQGSEQSKWENMTADELKKNMYAFEGPVPEKKVSETDRQLAFDNYSVTDDHLMHLTALVKDQNGTLYYTTKNSWDAKSNEFGGYLNMSDAYLRMNTVAIMVHKDAIPKALKKKLGLL
jgi:bleomycin hydrolase